MSTSYQVQQLLPSAYRNGDQWVVVHDGTDLEKAQAVLSAIAISDASRVRLVTLSKVRYPAQKP